MDSQSPKAQTPSGRIRAGAKSDWHTPPTGLQALEALPRRGVVEGTVSWLSRCPHLDRDAERFPVHAATTLKRG